MATVSTKQSNWLDLALGYLRDGGYVIVERVLSADFVRETREAMYRVQEAIEAEIGKNKLESAKELGVLRLMMRYDDHFFRFLEVPEMLRVLNETISPTCILHTQNGFILPPMPKDMKPIAQNSFHMDFPRILNGYLSSMNAMFAIDDFTEQNGATVIVPGSHQQLVAPASEYMEHAGVPVLCESGSMFVFDSTLWHKAGTNASSQDRLAINHQFTRSYFKQQVDYCRGIDKRVIERLPERSKQLLGWYSRPPGSLQEYYVAPSDRLYKAGQG